MAFGFEVSKGGFMYTQYTTSLEASLYSSALPRPCMPVFTILEILVSEKAEKSSFELR